MKSTIILTIHNKQDLLPLLLTKLYEETNWIETEIIFVVDGCTDNSLALVEDWCNHHFYILTEVIITPNLFETKANNVGLKRARGKYVIIIQDDMIVNEKDWNVRILEPFHKWDDVFAVSANCAHNWELNPNSQGIKDGWSYLLNHIDHANKTNTPRNVFAIRDSVNRGPLAINRSALEKLNYFDEKFAPLDCDDHDLMYRMQHFMRLKKGNYAIPLVCGFYSVEWYSKPEWGGTRDQDGKPKQWALDAQIKNIKLLYERHKDYIHIHKNENREC